MIVKQILFYMSPKSEKYFYSYRVDLLFSGQEAFLLFHVSSSVEK